MISSKDIFVMCGILLSLNTVLLVVWTLVSPLEWTRVDESATDVFNRSTSSYGVCESDNSIAFVSLIGFVNFGLLLLGNWASYQCRNIETEYNESRYIGISMAATLQAWCMGVPILIVVWHNPQGRFYVQAGIVFVTTQAVLSTLYVPKVLHLYAARKKTRHDSGRESFAQIQQKSKMSFENMDSDDSAEQQPEALGVVASEAVDSQNSNPQAPPMGPSSGAFSDDPESEVLQAAAEMTAAALTPIDDKPQSVNTPVRGLSRKSQSSMSIRSRRGSDESGSREFSSSGASSARNLSDTSSIRHASQSSRHISQSSRNFSRSSRNFSQSSRSISDSRRDVWGVFQMGAHSSRAIDSASTKSGIKVLHNPRVRVFLHCCVLCHDLTFLTDGRRAPYSWWARSLSSPAELHRGGHIDRRRSRGLSSREPGRFSSGLQQSKTGCGRLGGSRARELDVGGSSEWRRCIV